MKRTVPPKSKPEKRSLFDIDEQLQELALDALGGSPFFALNKRMLTMFGPQRSVFLTNLTDKFRYFKSMEMLQSDGAFFLTHSDQMEDTGLSESQIRSCKNWARDEGFLRTMMRGQPAKEFYLLNLQAVVDSLFPALKKPVGLDLKKPVGLDLKKPVGLSKENKGKENQGKESPHSPPADADKDFLLLAKDLAAIVESQSNCEVSHHVPQWVPHFRRLHRMERIPIERMRVAMDWYEEHVGEKYVPVIACGRTFREKWLQLEAAIKRDQDAHPPEIDPEDVLTEAFPNKDIRSSYQKRLLSPAVRMLESEPGVIAQALVKLDSYITQSQREHLTESQRMGSVFLDSFTMIEYYLDWLREQDWIDYLDVKLLDPNHGVFKRFRKEQARRDPYGRDQLTGRSMHDEG